MREIKLMADYGCFPLWESSPGSVGNIDPNTLSISDDLKFRLEKWSHQYDSTLNPDDPLRSGFPSLDAKGAFEREGQLLAKLLGEELGSKFKVVIQI